MVFWQITGKTDAFILNYLESLCFITNYLNIWCFYCKLVGNLLFYSKLLENQNVPKTVPTRSQIRTKVVPHCFQNGPKLYNLEYPPLGFNWIWIPVQLLGGLVQFWTFRPQNTDNYDNDNYYYYAFPPELETVQKNALLSRSHPEKHVFEPKQSRKTCFGAETVQKNAFSSRNSPEKRVFEPKPSTNFSFSSKTNPNRRFQRFSSLPRVSSRNFV